MRRMRQRRKFACCSHSSSRRYQCSQNLYASQARFDAGRRNQNGAVLDRGLLVSAIRSAALPRDGVARMTVAKRLKKA
jgi:hypothetical protein